MEVAPAAVDPVTGRTFAAILADLSRSSGLIKSVAAAPCRPRNVPLYHSFTKAGPAKPADMSAV